MLTGSVAFATDTMVKGDGYTLASSHEGDDMKHDHDQMMKKDEEMKQKHMDKEHEGHDHGTKEKQ